MTLSINFSMLQIISNSLFYPSDTYYRSTNQATMLVAVQNGKWVAIPIGAFLVYHEVSESNDEEVKDEDATTPTCSCRVVLL